MNVEVKKAAHLTGHSGSVYALAGGKDPCIVLSGSGDKFIAAWDIERKESAYHFMTIDSLMADFEKDIVAWKRKRRPS